MKKILLLIAFISLIFTVKAQSNDLDYVFLNNGNVVKGVIEKEVPNQSVSIRSVNGELYEYKSVEVRKIAHGEAPKIPEVKENNPSEYKDYGLYDKNSFWCAAELTGGYSCNLHKDNIGFTELNFVGGYRINEFLRFGIGLGARYYFNSKDLRDSSIEWSFPIFFNVRGNIIASYCRTVVPFYSLDLGGACRDGFMVRPTIGLRIGHNRSAFILGASFVGQNIDSFSETEDGKLIKEKMFLPSVALKIGYEF